MKLVMRIVYAFWVAATFILIDAMVMILRLGGDHILGQSDYARITLIGILGAICGWFVGGKIYYMVTGYD